MKTLLLGLGANARGDRAVGALVARRLSARGCPATVRLVGGTDLENDPGWNGHDRVIVVEGTADGRTPGTIHRAEHHVPEGNESLEPAGSHPAGIEEIIQRAGHLPAHLEVLSISIPDGEDGSVLSHPVAVAADHLVDELSQELTEPLSGRSRHVVEPS